MPSLRSAISGGDSDVKIHVSTTTDNKGIDDTKKGLKSAGDQADDTGKRFDQFGRIAAVAVTAIAAATVAFAVSSVKAFKESQEVVAQTEAVIKSTGGAAGVTADQISEMATAMQKVTRFSDETVQSGQNMLLTFTNIGKDVFPDATKTMLDMSQALGQDVKGSAIQLGKALNDPIRGVSALRKVGVTFTESQEDQIKTLVESGKTMEAQKVVLAELSKEFGGSAVAAGETFGGQLDRMNNQLGQFQESIGEVIVKGIAPITLGILGWIDSMGGVEGIAANTMKWLEDLGEGFMKVYTPIAEYLSPKLSELWKSIQESLIPSLEYLWKNVIEPFIPIIGTVLVGAIGLVVDTLRFLIDGIGMVKDGLETGNPIVIGLAIAFGTLAGAMAFNAVFTALQSGFTLLTVTTIPAVMAKITAIKALITAPVTMGAISVIAALAAIGLVMAAVISVQNAIKAMNDAASAKAGLDKVNDEMRAQAEKAYAAGDKAKGDRYMDIANSNNVDAPSGFDQFVTGTSGKFATGSKSTPGGRFLVGEGGAEVVDLPAGSKVYNHNESKRMMSGGGGRTTIIVENMNVNSADAMEVFLNAQDEDQRDIAMGLAPRRGTR